MLQVHWLGQKGFIHFPNINMYLNIKYPKDLTGYVSNKTTTKYSEKFWMLEYKFWTALKLDNTKKFWNS